MYTVRYEAGYTEEQSRAVTFFRLIVVVPRAIAARVRQLREIACLLLMTETLPPASDQAPAPSLGPGESAATTIRRAGPAAA